MTLASRRVRSDSEIAPRSSSDFASITSAWIGVRESGCEKPVTPAASAVLCAVTSHGLRGRSVLRARGAREREDGRGKRREGMERKRKMEAIELFQSDGRGTESGSGTRVVPAVRPLPCARITSDRLMPTWPLCRTSANQVQRDFLSQPLGQHP